MKQSAKWSLVVLSVVLLLPVSHSFAAPVDKTTVLDAMRKAGAFMADSLAYRGGYLWYYSEDLSEQWGEAPARPTQIWVQGATYDVGEMFLFAFDATGDDFYLSCAQKAADALIYGQHPLGGWHYFIEFDKPGLADWYERVFSKFKWGMEEYRHYYGNCTYDDDTTQGATRFLLHFYMKTLDPAYRTPLLKALDFILMSQYPNGAWPQRYPLKYDFTHDGLADYTSYYTMNDNSMRDTLNVLVEAWKQLGDERYLEAALRGVDWMLAAQGPEGQAAWAEQYGMDMLPAWARTHEPAGYMPRQTTEVCRQLMDFYVLTGDRRYIDAVGRAIDWLEKSKISIESNGRYHFARYYEVGTNKPIYQHRKDTINEEGYGLYYYNDDSTGVTGGWAFTELDINSLMNAWTRLNALSDNEVKEEREHRRHPRAISPKVDDESVRSVVSGMDSRGAWVETITVYDTTKTMTDDAYKTIRGMAISRCILNMRLLANAARWR